MKKIIPSFLLLVSLYLNGEEPHSVFLTWQEDPTTSIVVTWITSPEEKTNSLFYKQAGESNWKQVEGTQNPFPLNFPYVIHKVNLTQLSSNTKYTFKTGNEEKEWRFRTLSNNPEVPLVFIVGGDLYNGHKKHFVEAAKTAAMKDPMFTVIGGDIAYAHERKVKKEKRMIKQKRWLMWLKLWTEEMITSDGYLIPIVPVIGNHDTFGHFNQTPNQSPIYYALFPTPYSQGYYVLDISQHVSLITLDSSHTHPICGRQSLWLNKVMKERQAVPHKFAIYHVPAYPSVRKPKGRRATLIRKYWSPSFEKYGLTVAFEHHEHTYKRTHPIRNHQIDPDGVVYMGDGGWGVKNIREPKNLDQKSYLASTSATQHFILVTIQGDERQLQAIDMQGQVFDELKSVSKPVILEKAVQNEN